MSALLTKLKFSWRAILHHKAWPSSLSQVESQVFSKAVAGDLSSAAHLLNANFSFLATSTRFGNVKPESAMLKISLVQDSIADDPMLFLASSNGCGIKYYGDFKNQAHSWYIARLLSFHRIFERRAITTGPFESVAFHLGDCFDVEESVLTPCSRAVRPILVPDPDFITSYGYTAVRNWCRNRVRPWRDRHKTVFWRGGVNCSDEQKSDWRSNPRIKLVLALQQGSPCLSCDVGVVEADYIYKDTSSLEQIRAAGVIKEKAPWSEFSKFQFSIDIDGRSNAWAAFFTKLLMGSVVFKIESPAGYKQWFYERLQPFKHYIPVASDLSDLEGRLHWAADNHSACSEISAHAKVFAESLDYSTELQKAAM